ncbi:hypothetical protein C2E23DRAFT_885526 [Lenzites betulinus]|nr:hypothetical protein C2E23DRAFT_885526 [Lenzites betulinus]
MCPQPAKGPDARRSLNPVAVQRMRGSNLFSCHTCTNLATSNRRRSPSPDLGDLSALIGRLNALASNPAAAVPAVKAAIRSYKASESSARDLISTVRNILDRNLDGTASIINALVDVVGDDEKKQHLLTAWNGFKVEQRSQFPELVPTATGSEWAGVTSGRVLNAKNSTAARSHTQSSRQLLDRVARAAESTQPSSSRPARSTAASFPPLQSAAAGSSSSAMAGTARHALGVRRGCRRSSSAPRTRRPRPDVRPRSRGEGEGRPGGPAVFSKSAFPELPTGNGPRVPRGAVGGN